MCFDVCMRDGVCTFAWALASTLRSFALTSTRSSALLKPLPNTVHGTELLCLFAFFLYSSSKFLALDRNELRKASRTTCLMRTFGPSSSVHSASVTLETSRAHENCLMALLQLDESFRSGHQPVRSHILVMQLPDFPFGSPRPASANTFFLVFQEVRSLCNFS